jgi:mycothiol synthase
MLKRAVLQSWCKQLDAAAHHLLTWQGFVPERYFRSLQIDLLQTFSPLRCPEGINVRSFLRGQDERGAYETSAEAFATTEDASENLSFEEWCRRGIDTADFDPSLAFLAVQQDRIIGVAFGWLITGDSGTIGWITNVAVRPAYRGQGIAQALLQQVFATCKHRGAPLCALAVDTENPGGATHLYERVGMRESMRCDVRYQKVLREPV